MFDLSKYKREFLSKGDAIFWVVNFTVCGFVIVTLNLITILAFVTNRTLRRRSVHCLINLAMADLLYGITGLIYCFCIYGFILMNLDVDPTFVRLVFFILVFTLLASILSLVTVTLERICAFFLPFRHRVASQRIYIAVFVVCWVLALIVSLLVYILTYRASLIMYYVVVALSVIIILSSYAAIFTKMKKDNPQEFQNQSSVCQRRQIQEKKLAKTLCIVTVFSFITWVPYIAYRFSYIHLDQDDLLTTQPNMYNLMYLFQRMNSVVNPIVYLFRMRDFRKAVSQIICRCYCNGRVDASNGRVDAYPLGHRNAIT